LVSVNVVVKRNTELTSESRGNFDDEKINLTFLILNFRRVMNVVCFLLGNSPAAEFYMPTFRNTLSVPSS